MTENRRILGNRWVRAGLGLAVVAVAFGWALPSFASYGEVWSRLTVLDRSNLLPLLLVGAANLVAPSTSQRAALPGLRLRDAVTTDWATTTVTNLLPGGSALAIGLTWRMYRSFGLATGAITRSIVVTGVWDNLVKLGTPLLAVIWLATQRPVGPGLIQAAAVGAILFVVAVGLGVVVLSGPRAGAVVGRRLDRLPLIARLGSGTDGEGWVERLEELRRETVVLLADRWRALTFWTVAGHANLYLLLVVCIRAVGIERSALGWAPVLAALAFGRLVTAIPLTPGGLGVMELGLVGALSAVGPAVGAAPDASIVAAVLLFRFFTFAAPIPLGAVALAWWQTTATGPDPDRR